MSKQLLQFARMAAIFPFFATTAWPFPFFSVATNIDGTTKAVDIGAYFLMSKKSEESVLSPQKKKEGEEQEAREKELEGRAAKIDGYMRERSMPLAGFGMKMASAAEENEIDWRLLPAIAVRESSGGKKMCGNNPFGWGSCKIHFKSIDAGIETLALHLSGKHPNTDHYYNNTDTREKLYRYNGTVIPTYVDEVVAIMDRIEKQVVE